MDRLKPFDPCSLEQLCPGGVAYDVDLSAISQWRIGGRARVLLRPSCTAEVATLRRCLQEAGQPHVVIGSTSNLLFADEGLNVPCIQIGPRMAGITIEGTDVQVQAGAWVPDLARRLMQAGLTGAEHVCGIPGTLGGLICMNGGSQRKGVGSHVVTVESVDAAGRIRIRTAPECGFAYRQSIYQTNGEIITAVHLRLAPGEREAIRSEMLKILAERRRKFPRKEPNCGSVFKSNPAMYAEIGPPGAAIERLGFKGMREGGAQVSHQHANFIVNTGAARAEEVLNLVDEIKRAVSRTTGRFLEAEVIYVSPEGDLLQADKVRAIRESG